MSKRKMSVEARKRISEGMKRRYAEMREQVAALGSTKKNRISGFDSPPSGLWPPADIVPFTGTYNMNTTEVKVFIGHAHLIVKLNSIDSRIFQGLTVK